jgi:putative methionine-R-sulfoxide reductase with GAF domain
MTFSPPDMPPRTLASLAHALAAAADLDQALIALGETLAELDRGASLAFIHYDARREMLKDRLEPVGARVIHHRMDTTLDHLPETVRARVLAGGPFVDVTDRTADYARLCGFSPLLDGGVLSVRGMKMDGMLGAVLVLYEPRKIFGTRTTDRLAPSVALFELAYSRLAERDARDEAVRTLEDVTQRVHGDYVRKLSALEAELREVRNTPKTVTALDPAEMIAVQAEAARAGEDARRAARNAELADQQLTAAVAKLEQAHIELHRRSEALRQRTRTLYLVDRALTLDAETADPRALVDALLALVGDDMQAQRCSLMLRAPEPDHLYLAAARGLTPNIVEGMRIRIGEGVAGRVAAAREPLLVQDVREATRHPLLRDQYFTTGSFISFPLMYHGALVGVLNLTNRAQRGVYTEEDVERVRLLGLVISLISSRNDLPTRLLETVDVR